MFNDRVTSEFQFSNWQTNIKNVNNIYSLIDKTIALETFDNTFYLLPFSILDLENEDSINQLVIWRNAHQYAYPTRFEANFHGTYRWLESILNINSNRVMFWITSKSLQKIGHIGISLNKEGFFEIDNVLRGYSSTKGAITASLQYLEKLVQNEFVKDMLVLKVLESNTRAKNFYLKLGFEEYKRESLVFIEEDSSIKLVPGTPADDTFLYMKKNIKFPPKARILTAGPSITSLEISNVREAVTFGWNENHSNFIEKFENNFAEYIGVKYAISTSSCTGALHLSLLALGITKGDEVLVPEITWVATASAVKYVGAKPIFVDIDEKTWTISIEDARKKISERTKAIIPVHLYGYSCDMSQVMSFAQEFNLFVVEDAAPAIGATYKNQKLGSFGEIGCFSFQGAKMLVTGEGGMIVTDDEDLYKKVRKLQDHGRVPGTFWIDQLGYKYKMNNVTAALGSAQLDRVSNQIARKTRINTWYREELSSVNGIKFQEVNEYSESIHWMNSIKFPDIEIRDKVLISLKNSGIDTRLVFPAISQYPIWDYQSPIGKNANILQNLAINLPSGVELNKSDVEKISRIIATTIKENE